MDDSAIRRVIIPETFMALDEMLVTMKRVLIGCHVREDVMLGNLLRETQKMVSEGVLMLAVKRGGDRQELHEAMRQYLTLDPVNFMNAVSSDDRFAVSVEEMFDLMNIEKMVGAAPAQVEGYLKGRKQ